MIELKKQLTRFRDWNVRVANDLTPEIVKSSDAYVKFDELATAALRDPRTHSVLDVGAGKTFHFAKVLAERPDLHIIGHDISGEEMEENTSLKERIVGDACVDLPLPDASVDLVLARATIEHLHDTPSFVRNAFRVLKPGGRIVVTFANKWATFAIINRLIPARLKLSLLRALMPGSAGVLGFETHYDDASYGRFRDILLKAGFKEEVSYVGYYGHYYFRFFLPFWFFAMMSDAIRHMIGNPHLSSYNAFLFSKPA